MKTISSIQRLIAFMLLLVFSTATAPKAFFHDLVADHEDVAGCTIQHDGEVLHQVENDCDFDDLVVPASFTYTSWIGFVSIERNARELLPIKDNKLLSKTFLHVEGRGPPAA